MATDPNDFLRKAGLPAPADTPFWLADSGPQTSPFFAGSPEPDSGTFWADWDTPGLGKPTEFGSTLNLTPKQYKAERDARREGERLESTFYRAGYGEDWEEFYKNRGATGIIGTANQGMKTVVSGLFDLTSMLQHGVTGAVQEYMRTGSAWEGVKQSAVEMANDLPFVNIESARQPGWNEVIQELGVEKGYTSAVAGLILDLALDPMNLVPGAALVKGSGKAVKTLKELPGIKRLAGPVGKGLDFLFTTPIDKIKRDVGVVNAGMGPAGEAFAELVAHREGLLERDIALAVKRADAMWDGMTPMERVVVGLYSHKPDVARDAVMEMERIGVVPAGGVQRTLNAIDAVQNRFQVLKNELIAHGALPPSINMSTGVVYMPGREMLDPRAKRGMQRMLAKGNPGLKEPGIRTIASSIPGLAQEKLYKTVEERFAATLAGTPGRYGIPMTTEIDAGNLMAMYEAESVKAKIDQLFMDAVIQDGRISAKVNIPSTKKGVPLFQLDDKTKWEAWKRDLRARHPGFDVLEMKRVVHNSSGKGVSEEIVDARVVPMEISHYIAKLREVRDPGVLDMMMEGVQSLTSPWKALATFGTGFHFRNLYSALTTNWFAEVGAEKVKGWLGSTAGVAHPTGKFVQTHLEGFNVLANVEGAGEMPEALRRALDKTARKSGFKSLKDVPFREPLVNGRRLSMEETYKLAQEYSVIQLRNELFEAKPDDIQAFWKGFSNAEQMALLSSQNIPDLLKGAATIEPDSMTPVEMARWIGSENKVMKGHRLAAQVTDNMTRMALFLDRLHKGASPYEASLEVKKYHFDMNNLTEIERKFLMPLIPFYTWTRFAVPRWFMAALENPGRFSKQADVISFMSDMGQDLKDAPKPDYYEEVQMAQLPWTHSGRPEFVQLDLPVLSLNTMNYDDVMASLNPALRLFAETSSGKDMFTGDEIEKFSGEKSDAFPWMSKLTEHRISTLVPPVGKLLRMKKSLGQDTVPEQAIGETFGFRPRALDVRRVMRANTFEKRKLAREFLQIMRQDMESRAGDSE